MAPASRFIINHNFKDNSVGKGDREGVAGCMQTWCFTYSTPCSSYTYINTTFIYIHRELCGRRR